MFFLFSFFFPLQLEDNVVYFRLFLGILSCYYLHTPEEALAQIDSKQYAIPYQADGRKVYKIGVNFDSATRTIGGWKIVEV